MARLRASVRVCSSRRCAANRVNRLSLVLAALAAVSFAVRVSRTGIAGSGQGRHLGQEKKSHRDEDEQGEGHQDHERRRHSYRFERREREVIAGYYSNEGQGLPPGLAKRGGNLPPGLEKHLERDGTLPPGLQKRLEPLPVGLERELPPLPVGCGCRRGIIGTNVLLIRTRDFSILDVLRIGTR